MKEEIRQRRDIALREMQSIRRPVTEERAMAPAAEFVMAIKDQHDWMEAHPQKGKRVEWYFASSALGLLVVLRVRARGAKLVELVVLDKSGDQTLVLVPVERCEFYFVLEPIEEPPPPEPRIIKGFAREE